MLDRVKAGDLASLPVLSVASSTREDVRSQLVEAGLLEWLQSFQCDEADQACLRTVSWLYLNISLAADDFDSSLAAAVLAKLAELFEYHDPAIELDCLSAVGNFCRVSELAKLVVESPCMDFVLAALDYENTEKLLLALEVLSYCYCFQSEATLAVFASTSTIAQCLNHQSSEVRHEAGLVLCVLSVEAPSTMLEEQTLNLLLSSTSLQGEALFVLENLSKQHPAALARMNLLPVLTSCFQVVTQPHCQAKLVSSLCCIIENSQNWNAAEWHYSLQATGILQMVEAASVSMYEPLAAHTC